MTQSRRPRQPRPDRTGDALLMLVEAVLDEFFMDPDNQDKYEKLARGGRRARVKAGETVSLGSMDLPDGGEAWLAVSAGSPPITVAVTHPGWNATVSALYVPDIATMAEAEIIRIEGDRAEVRACADKWVDDLSALSLDDDDDEEDLDDAMAAFLSGGGSPFDGAADPGEPPPPSARLKAEVNALARAVSRQIKRKKPDMESLQDDMLVLEQSPQALWPIFDGLVEACTASARDDALIDAWRFLLENQLTLIRYRIDRGWDWAVRMAEEYQRKLIEIGREGRVPSADFAAMAGALGEARIDVKPETRVAFADAGLTPPEAGQPEELVAMMRGLMDQMASSISDPFDLVDGLGEATRVMPSELRCFMAHEFALSPHAVLRDAVPLMLLADEQDVRRAAAAALEQIATPETMSPEALRRMIAVRNWVPEADRPAIDQGIRKARTKGVDCAQWPPAQDLMINASMVDGSGAQSVILTSRAGRQGVLAGMLLKLAAGVADSWCDTEVPRRSINETLAALRRTSFTAEVDRAYLDDAVQHAIAIGTTAGQPPGQALVRIAELAGGAGWRDRRMDIAAEAKRLFDQLPADRRSPAAVEASLERSGDWIGEDFARSWFIDDAEIRDIVKRGPRRDPSAAARRLMAEAMPKRKAEWAERFLLLALRARAARDKATRAYLNDLIILAHSLNGNRELATIPLMVAIAGYTAEVTQTVRW